jgi:hypothetical protein
LTDLLGGVHAEGVHDVTEEEHVEFTLAVPVVDVADLLDSCREEKYTINLLIFSAIFSTIFLYR